METYTCTVCGKIHGEWPALTYSSPTAYEVLPEKDKKEIAELDSDFCVIRHADQTDRFIRVVMRMKVTNYCEDLHYGLWVSLSEKSFADYSENYGNENHEAQYFGWLSSDLPGYDFEKSIPTTVYAQGTLRPEIIPHKEVDHPFVHDYYNGITKAEAEKRIMDLVKTVEARDKKEKRKKWWKSW